MEKIIDVGSWTRMTDQCVQIVKVSSRGLIGSDRKNFLEKRAGHTHFVDAIDKGLVKLAKGDLPIHILAVGATEGYGPNRNGDGFDEATCIARHHTFAKEARYYRHHKNKHEKGDPYYGRVKLSAYNLPMRRIECLTIGNMDKEAADRNGGLPMLADTLARIERGDDVAWSMACALAGTLVKVRHGFKPVEQVEQGDEVLSHLGRYCKVYAAASRTRQHYTEFRLQGWGRQVLEFTPDHLFFVGRWSQLPQSPFHVNGLQSKDPTGFSRSFRTRRKHELAAHAQWVPCGELQAGDYLLMPIPRGTGRSKLANKEARLLGYYMAEGSPCDGGICLTCNKEDPVVSEVQSLVGDETKVGYYDHSASAKAYNLNVFSSTLAATCLAEIGCGVRNKKIPQRVYNAPDGVKLEFLATWLNGDGWQDVKGLHWSTCSRTLSLELQMLLASVGIPASAYRIDHTSDLPDRPRTGDGIEYTVNVSNRYSGMFAGRSKAVVMDPGAPKEYLFITGQYLAVPLLSVRQIEKQVTVYDISVEQDDSFTAFGLAVHNCKVAADVCQNCFNKAASRGEYCTEDTCIHPETGRRMFGCKTGLTKLGEDGCQQFVENPECSYFDLSEVVKPADRGCYGWKADYLTKAAACGHVVGGAELAELWALENGYVIEKTAQATVRNAVLYKLATIESQLETDPALQQRAIACAFTSSIQPPMDLGPAGEPGTRKLATALKALAGQKIAMPFRDFVRLFSQGDLVKSAAVTCGVLRHLPGVFSRLALDQGLEEKLASNPYAPAAELAPMSQRKWAEASAQRYSLDKSAVQNRVLRSALRSEPIPAFIDVGGEKEASVAGEDIARAYALYKLAFLETLADDPQFGELCELAVLQNYIS